MGIVGVDCAQARSQGMLRDCSGKVLLPPTLRDPRRDAVDQAIAPIGPNVAAHQLRDLVVVGERTGRDHLPVQRACTTAGHDLRVVHPRICRSFRHAAHPAPKTDATDLEGIFQAAGNGYGLREAPGEPVASELPLGARHRPDLVPTSTRLGCQILEQRESCSPGYARCLDNVFQSGMALVIPGAYPTPQAITQAGRPGLIEGAHRAGVRVQTTTLIRIVAWAPEAPQPDREATLHARLLPARNRDRLSQEDEIQSMERERVGLLVQPPAARLLARAGIPGVLAAALAGALGPMGPSAPGGASPVGPDCSPI